MGDSAERVQSRRVSTILTQLCRYAASKGHGHNVDVKTSCSKVMLELTLLTPQIAICMAKHQCVTHVDMYRHNSKGPSKASESGTQRSIKAADTVLVIANNDMFD